MTFAVKIVSKSGIRRVTLGECSFENLLVTANLPPKAVVRYEDEDEDVLTISSTAELSEAFRFAECQGKTLRLSVIVTEDDDDFELVSEEGEAQAEGRTPKDALVEAECLPLLPFAEVPSEVAGADDQEAEIEEAEIEEAVEEAEVEMPDKDSPLSKQTSEVQTEQTQTVDEERTLAPDDSHVKLPPSAPVDEQDDEVFIRLRQLSHSLRKSRRCHRSWLRFGSHGAAVRALQEKLGRHGYCIPVDGFFGPRTKRAVWQFQQCRGLSADAVVGPETSHALDVLKEGTKPTPSLPLRLGSRGNAVRLLQKALNKYGMHIAVDGFFGRQTAAAVKLSQRAKGLPIDGVVGPLTARAFCLVAEDQDRQEMPICPLKWRSRGDAVRVLQQSLNRHGYRLPIDGFFGVRTKRAVVQFQRAHALSVDGVVGPETSRALQNKLTPCSFETSLPLHMGSQGDAVRKLQTALAEFGESIVVDGIFWRQTRAAVALFQRANGLFVDGIVGPLTAHALSRRSSSEQGTHPGFRCDDCGVCPQGPRYKCTSCPDFDLCAQCEAKNQHPATHALLKIAAPSPAAPVVATHRGVSCDMCGVSPIQGARFKCSVCDNYDLCAACEGKGEHPRTHALLKMRTPTPCWKFFDAADKQSNKDEKKKKKEALTKKKTSLFSSLVQEAKERAEEQVQVRQVEEPAGEQVEQASEQDQADEEDGSELHLELDQLASMGFTDRPLNISLLTTNKGDVNSTVNMLLAL